MSRPEVLLSEADIQVRVRELAQAISEDYADVGEVLLVGVLKGAFVFLADLARALTIPRRVDFIALSSYPESDERTGEVRMIMDVRGPIEGQHVIVVEDIVDTGHTLSYLLGLLQTRRPASLATCGLLLKPDCQVMDVDVDYVGFEIPDVWVVGYGLDVGDQFRMLPYIGQVDPARLSDSG